MSKNIKLAINTFVGVLVSSGIYGIFAFMVSAGGGVAFLGIAFLLVMPLSIFVGSVATGYLSSGLAENFRNKLFISPGFYLALVFILNNLVFADLQFTIVMVVPAVIWSLVSVWGVHYGVKKRIIK